MCTENCNKKYLLKIYFGLRNFVWKTQNLVKRILVKIEKIVQTNFAPINQMSFINTILIKQTCCSKKDFDNFFLSKQIMVSTKFWLSKILVEQNFGKKIDKRLGFIKD